VDDLPGLEPLHESLRDQAFHRSVLTDFRRAPRRRLAVVLGGVVLLRIEDALDALLLAALHDRAVLRHVDGDRVAGHDVVVLPDPRVADEHHALVEVEVLGALRRAGAAVLGDDADRAGGDRSHHPVALFIHVDLDPIGVLDRVVSPGHDVAAEDDQARLAETLHLVRVHREGLGGVVLGVLRLGRAEGRGRLLCGRSRRGLRRRLATRQRGRREQQERGENRGRPHWRASVKTECTRPAIVVYSSAILTSSAEPSATAPPRESRTGASVQSRFSAPCQRSTLVSRRMPALEVTAPVDSAGGTRLLAISVPATARTKTVTIPRIAAATNRVLIALSILKGSRTGMQFRYHAITYSGPGKAQTP